MPLANRVLEESVLLLLKDKERGKRKACLKARREKERQGKVANLGTITGKERELADMMERRKLNILCVQETR